MGHSKALRGLIVDLVTPLRESGEIDGRSLGRHLDRILPHVQAVFIANQLFLVMGAQAFGAPATVAKSQRALIDCLRSTLDWQDFTVIEGAGLSRQNQVTPRQMMSLLRHFQQHRDLLPVKKTYFNAKTGTLHGVNTVVGYFDLDDGRTVRFVIMINDNVGFNYRFQLAQQLRNHLNAQSP